MHKPITATCLLNYLAKYTPRCYFSLPCQKSNPVARDLWHRTHKRTKYIIFGFPLTNPSCFCVLNFRLQAPRGSYSRPNPLISFSLSSCASAASPTPGRSNSYPQTPSSVSGYSKVSFIIIIRLTPTETCMHLLLY